MLPALACVALLLALIHQAVGPAASPLEADPVGLAPRRSKPLAVAPTPPYAAILAAPIFAPNRINADTGLSATAGADATAPAGSLSLVGVAIGPRSASAVLRGTDGSTRVVRRGERIGGWRVVAVGPTSVRLSGAEGPLTLPLASNDKSAQP